MSERIFDGRYAFEELLHSGNGQPSALDAVLSARRCSDESLLKIAHAVSPHDPLSAYERMGGGYLATGVKLSAAPMRHLSGGLKESVKLFQHQQDAVDKILSKDGNLLLSHPVGSGKTLTSIAAFESLRKEGKAERALVVAPASLRTNFVENGIKRFTNSRGAIFGNAQEAASGSHVTAEKPDPRAQYHVVSYELFRADPKKYIDAARADTVIYDELHRAKNEGVLTSKAIKDARQYHRNFIGMTGSIVSNTPADIVPLVDAMTDGNHLLGNKTTFESRFVKENDDGSKTLKNPQVLRALLAPYVHHVDQQQLNTKTPGKRIEEVRIDMSPHQTQLYRFLTNELDPITKLKMKAGMSHLNNASLNDMFAKLIRLRQVSNSIHTMDMRVTPEQSSVETPKIKRILDDVEDHIRETSDAQVVLHTNLIHGGVDVLTAGLKARGIDHALFIGKGNAGITEKTRQFGVKEFQEGKKKVIVLSAAGGEGLDLPNTTFMGMLDGHFNPEKINQSEARGIRAGGQAHRAEDKRNVLIRRYVSVVPKDLGEKVTVIKNIWENINPVDITKRIQAGGAAFYNPFKKSPSTDEWVYGVAKRKSGLNKSMHETIKTSAVLETHEQIEEAFESLEKDADISVGTVNKVWNVLKKHPEIATTPAGLAWGALIGGTGPRSKREVELDPNAPMRNRIAGTIGGGIGGYTAGRMLASGRPFGILSNFGLGPTAAMNVADLAAPRRTVPKSVQNLLGDRQRYSDKALFEKYWEKFGPELETEGLKTKVKDEELEARFVGALKDLYQESATVKPSLAETIARTDSAGKVVGKPSKTKFLATQALATGLGSIGTGAYGEMLAVRMGQKPSLGMAALGAVTPLIGQLAHTAKAYRDMYMDPGVESSAGKADTRKRSKFSDEQLQLLLRGMNVDEIKTKSHFIK